VNILKVKKITILPQCRLMRNREEREILAEFCWVEHEK
jgi:hypothetical protein